MKGNKVKKPIYKRAWFIVLVILVLIGAIGSCGGNDNSNGTAATVVEEPEDGGDYTFADEPYEEDEPEESEMTMGQKNALQKAELYLDMGGFSRQSLIDQLLFEGFTQKQAEYGASSVGY